MSLEKLQYKVAAGQSFTESIQLVRDFGVEEVIPANEISSVRLSLRRKPSREAPAIITKELARVADDYPFSLSAEETESLKEGIIYADVRVELTGGVVTYPVRFELKINATTTA